MHDWSAFICWPFMGKKNRLTAKTSCWGFFKALLTINWKLICAGPFLHTGGKTSRVINTLLFLELSAACWWNAAHHMTLTYRGEGGGSATVVYFDNGWEKIPLPSLGFAASPFGPWGCIFLAFFFYLKHYHERVQQGVALSTEASAVVGEGPSTGSQALFFFPGCILKYPTHLVG